MILSRRDRNGKNGERLRRVRGGLRRWSLPLWLVCSRQLWYAIRSGTCEQGLRLFANLISYPKRPRQ